ncbi:MAG: hypothetical protein SGJ10_10775 [Bacteroidota bacterium]|nr:hypothetical protein [Bacteroidota bacterium]
MFKKVHLVIVLLVLSRAAIAQVSSFPAEFEGLWEGELKVYKPSNIQDLSVPKSRQRVTMQLEITKNDTAHCWNFTIRYMSQGQPDERKYLLKRDSSSGSYIIDEQNSLRLNSYLLGNVLVERFSLPEKDITSIYKFSADTVFTQIISSEVAPVTWTGGSKGIPKIFSYEVDGYQDAVLVKKKR